MSGNDHPFPAGRSRHGGNLSADIRQFRTGIYLIVIYTDRDFSLFSRLQVISIDVTTLLVNNTFIPDCREFYIIFLVGGKSFILFRAHVVSVKIHHVVPVGYIINRSPVGRPHGDDILPRVIGYLFGFLGSEVKHPYVISHTALITLPRAKFPHDIVVRQFFPVGRIRGETTVFQRHLFRHSALDRYRE